MKTRRDKRVFATEMKLRGSTAGLTFPVWAQKKIDGEYNWLVNDPDRIPYTVNKYGLIRYDYPVTQSIPPALRKHHFILIGELYYGDGKNGALYDLLQNKENDALNFYVFDILSLGMDATPIAKKPFIERMERLWELGLECQVQGMMVENPLQLTIYFESIIKLGYEGIVVKDLNSPLMLGPSNWVKMKKKDVSEFQVCSIDPVRQRIEVVVDTSTPGVHKRVGCKCSNKDKRTLKVGDVVKIEHQGILAGGGLRHPVYKGKGGGGENGAKFSKQ